MKAVRKPVGFRGNTAITRTKNVYKTLMNRKMYIMYASAHLFPNPQKKSMGDDDKK